jgi:hypothetical protein
MHWLIRRWVLASALCLTGFHLPLLAAQTLSLAELPYRDPRALDRLLARDELSFNNRLQRDWPRTMRTLALYIPAGVQISPSSLLFSTLRERCTQQREPAACRLYMDFLAFLMKQKRAAPAPANTSLPVLLRPAQLPFKGTAILDALARQDAATLQSALSSHWDWIHDVIGRYLPDHFSLYPISKVFASIRDSCQNAKTEIACRLHLADIDSLVDSNRQQAPTLFRTLGQLPYRDPAPLDNLLKLSQTAWKTQGTNWPRVEALLHRYIAWPVAIVGDTDFARARLDCLVVMPGDYIQCRNYLVRLADLMRSKRGLANPFLPLSTKA